MNGRPLVSCRIPPLLTTINVVCELPEGQLRGVGWGCTADTAVTPALHHPKAPECRLASAIEITILESAGEKKHGGGAPQREGSTASTPRAGNEVRPLTRSGQYRKVGDAVHPLAIPPVWPAPASQLLSKSPLPCIALENRDVQRLPLDGPSLS